MSLNSINTNISAYYAQQNIGKASNMASSSIARLSSGNRIVRAADDVAALSAGTSLKTNVTTLRTALVNTAQGSSLLQVADGALSQVTDILQRQKAIAVQAGAGSLTNSERSFLNQEFQNLTQEVDRLVGQTNFNGVKLLDGSLTSNGSFKTNDPAAFGNYVVSGEVGTNAAISAASNPNPSVIGDVTSVTAANILGTTDGSAVEITMKINGVVFQGQADFSGLAGDGTADVTLTLTEVNPKAGSSAMTFSMVVEDEATWSNVGALNTMLGNQFGDAYVSQQRGLTGFTSTTANGSVLEGMTASPTFTTWTMDTATTVDGGDAFGNVEKISVARVGTTGNATGSIDIMVNGEKFSLADLSTATGGDGILGAANTLTFTRSFEGSSRTETIAVALTGLDADINVNTAQGAAALEKALGQVFGLGDSSAVGGLKFQVGATTADTLTVALEDVGTGKLFNDVKLDVLTQTSAAAASDAIDAAIKTVTSVRAEVGALQSRFDFATANVESSIQNQDAARGVLLDTDISAESTKFATAQVQMQAGIAVLAQANQMPQNLLKLIGN